MLISPHKNNPTDTKKVKKPQITIIGAKVSMFGYILSRGSIKVTPIRTSVRSARPRVINMEFLIIFLSSNSFISFMN